MLKFLLKLTKKRSNNGLVFNQTNFIFGLQAGKKSQKAHSNMKYPTRCTQGYSLLKQSDKILTFRNREIAIN